eukprot:m.253856 g.253856  ORF g.253856 m.253856 type:complete len:1140 (+) comp17546_c0_seq1:202-3621(+)
MASPLESPVLQRYRHQLSEDFDNLDRPSTSDGRRRKSTPDARRYLRANRSQSHEVRSLTSSPTASPSLKRKLRRPSAQSTMYSTMSDLSSLQSTVVTPPRSAMASIRGSRSQLTTPSRMGPLERIRGYEDTIGKPRQHVHESLGELSQDELSDSSQSQDGSTEHVDKFSFDTSMQGIRGRSVLTGDGINTFTVADPVFSPPTSRATSRSGLRSPRLTHSSSLLSSSWLFDSLGEDMPNYSEDAFAARHQNKVVISLDARGICLTANNRAFELFECSADDLLHKPLLNYIQRSEARKAHGLINDMLLYPDQDGKETLRNVSSRIVSIVTKHNNTAAASLWITRVSQPDDQDARFLAVLEPVIRSVTHVAVDGDLNLLWAEPDFCLLHNYRPETFTTSFLHHVLPSLNRRAWFDIKHALQRSSSPALSEGNMVPVAGPVTTLLSASTQSSESRTPQASDDDTSSVYHIANAATIATPTQSPAQLQSVLGAVTTPAGSPSMPNPLSTSSAPVPTLRELVIEPSQDNDAAVVVRIASHVQLGQPMPCQLEVEPAQKHDREELEELAPAVALAQEVYVMAHIAYASMSGVISCRDNGLVFNGNSNFLQLVLGLQLADVIDRSIEILLPEFYLQADLLFSATSPQGTSQAADPNHLSVKAATPQQRTIFEGNFSGVATHADGTEICVDYTVKKVVLKDRSCMFVILITCLDGVADPQLSGYPSTENLSAGDDALSTGSLASHRPSLGRFSVQPSPSISRRGSFIAGAQRGEAYAGEFSLRYILGDTIGTGSFGFVKLARSKASQDLVVAKFIPKERIIDDGWTQNDGSIALPLLGTADFKPGYVPSEAFLLQKLDHPNIAKMLDLCHNIRFFQLVMEDHGAGFDLFSFVEDNPHLDEHIASFIFRQVVDAVAYLHSCNIVHRDVKDENIILNHEFSAKLIDFGSAAVYTPDRSFDTFAGTLEYCCPSVLKGNSYIGPEVDIFALGVTLYTMIFCEHPFFDVQETLEGALHPPHEASSEVLSLITGMLEADPKLRSDMASIQQHSFVTMDVSEKVCSILEDPEWCQGISDAQKEREGSVCMLDVESPRVPVAGPATPQQTRRSLRPVSVSSVDDDDPAEADLRAQILENMKRSGMTPETLSLNQTF